MTDELTDLFGRMFFADVTGRRFTPDVKRRRPGDPAVLVANGDLAARDLGWKMRHSIHDMVESAWSVTAGFSDT